MLLSNDMASYLSLKRRITSVVSTMRGYILSAIVNTDCRRSLGYFQGNVSLMGNRHTGHPQPEYHITELADGRIGNHPFYIMLHQTDSRGENRRKPTDEGHRSYRLRRMDEER